MTKVLHLACGSHDTILMLFQNKEKVEDAPGEDALTVMPKETKEKGVPRSLEHIVPCQILLKSGKFGKKR